MNADFKRKSTLQTIGNRASSILIALIALFCLVSCQKEKEQQPLLPVTERVLKPQTVTLSKQFSGSVEAYQTTALAFKLPGTVEKVYRPPGLDRDVQVGDKLAKGTVIAELEEGDLRRAKASAEAKVAQLEARVVTARDNLVIATRNYERFAQSSGSVSKVARDDADARRVSAAGELAAAEHALADAKVQLDQANDNYINRLLIVPFDGATVAEKKIEPGERVQGGVPAFQLIDISTVYIRFGVPDTMIGEPVIGASPAEQVYMGQELQVSSDAFEGRTLTATVTKIAPQADPQTRTFMTELTLPNAVRPDGQPLLRPGMIVTVHVGANKDHSVMLLPLSAIHPGRSPDENAVYEILDENGTKIVRLRKVMLGGVYNNQVEVLPEGSEVGAGSRIVISSAELLSDGATVRPLSADSAGVVPKE